MCGVDETPKMGIVKSHAQDNVLVLVTETLADAYASLSQVDPQHINPNDLARDTAYLRRRFAKEGLTFLTVTLPRLGEWTDKYVWGEKVERVEGFSPYDGLFPTFLRPFWTFFQTNRLAMEAGHCEVYRIIRTLLLGLKKLEVPSTPEQVAEKLASFLLIEEELVDFEVPNSPVLNRAQLIMEQFVRDYTPTCVQPKHGPGAVAGGERANGKWLWSHLYRSLHKEWPYWEYLYPVRSLVPDCPVSISVSRPRHIQLAALAGEYRSLTRTDYPVARLLFVPKDSRGPRVISCEPKELMYVQQGVASHLMKYIERHAFTKGHVNFERQDINRSLALGASRSRAFATIDLSDASDRVSVALIRYLFPERVARKWEALRSAATLLPNGVEQPLRKFAPMGSALCFPVESLVFWAIAVGTIWESSRDLTFALDSVFVYGDDIIVADAYAERVMDALELCCLRVNRSKSFHGDHPFRESCGMDALNGIEVTPLRVKKFPPSRSSDGDGLVAYVKYSENTESLCPLRAKFELRLVEELVGPIPRVPFPQPYLSIVTTKNVWSRNDFKRLKWDPNLSYWKSELLMIRNRKVESNLSGWKRLQHSITDRVWGDPTLVVERNSTLIRRKWLAITFLGF